MPPLALPSSYSFLLHEVWVDPGHPKPDPTRIQTRYTWYKDEHATDCYVVRTHHLINDDCPTYTWLQRIGVTSAPSSYRSWFQYHAPFFLWLLMYVVYSIIFLLSGYYVICFWLDSYDSITDSTTSNHLSRRPPPHLRPCWAPPTSWKAFRPPAPILDWCHSCCSSSCSYSNWGRCRIHRNPRVPGVWYGIPLRVNIRD